MLTDWVAHAIDRAVSIGMDGVTDSTLAELAQDIARDDAAETSSLRASPRRAKPADATADGAEGGAEDDEAETEAPPTEMGVGHHRGRSSSSMLNLLLDLDLGASMSLPGGDEEAEEWVSVTAPLAGGTVGVLGATGAAPPPAAASPGALARPSLRMLAAQQAEAEPDLISLNSPHRAT